MSTRFALYTIGMMNAKRWIISLDNGVPVYSYSASRAATFSVNEASDLMAQYPDLHSIAA